MPIGIPHDPVRTAHEWLCGDHLPAPERPKAGHRIGAARLRRLEARVLERLDQDPDVRKAFARMFALASGGISMVSKN